MRLLITSFLKKTGLVSIVVVGSSLAVNVNSVSASKTFFSPKLNGSPVASCLDSYRFNNGCNRAAKKEIANRFCKEKGYKRATSWQWQDRDWSNRVWYKMYTEKYVDGRLSRWWATKEGGFIFTGIECDD